MAIKISEAHTHFPSRVAGFHQGILTEIRNSLTGVFDVQNDRTERIVVIRIIRLELNGLFQRFISFLAEILLNTNHAEKEMNCWILGIQIPCAGQIAKCALVVLLPVGNVGQFKQNFGDCGSQATFGEVGWNHLFQHPKQYTVDQMTTSTVRDDQAAGRVFCNYTRGLAYMVWTQNAGNMLGYVYGPVHGNVWNWWVPVHHNIGLGTGAQPGWQQGTNSLYATQQVGAAVLGGRIWGAGGLTGPPDAAGETGVYDPTIGAWSRPSRRSAAC